MQAHRVEAKVHNGQIVINHMPFREGEKVEVIILPCPDTSKKERKNSLYGTSAEYIRPFEPPLPEEDWDVYK